MPKRYKVRDALRIIKDDGWYLHSMTGSHRQFKHETKKGRVTIAGKKGDTLHPKTAKSILNQAGLAD